MKYLVLAACLAAGLWATEVHPQELSEDQHHAIWLRIEQLERNRTKAFREGDCEAVLAHFADSVVFYARGRRLTSLPVILELCREARRPIREPESEDARIEVLSENAAYVVRERDFEPRLRQPGVRIREVETVLWRRFLDGWHIVHFHISVDPLPRE